MSKKYREILNKTQYLFNHQNSCCHLQSTLRLMQHIFSSVFFILRNIFCRRFLVSISAQATIFFLFPQSTQNGFHVVAISILETKKVEYGGWSMIFVAVLVLNSVTIAALCDGALSSCKIQKFFFHISGLFWLIFSRKCFKTPK